MICQTKKVVIFLIDAIIRTRQDIWYLLYTGFLTYHKIT